MTPAIQILLVEDDPTDTLLAEEALLGDRFRLQVSRRLDDALRLLKSHPFDVILLDLGLPDSQGLATLQALRAGSPQVPAILVLTGRI